MSAPDPELERMASALAAVVARAMTKRPEDRWSSAIAMRDAIPLP